MPRGDNAQERRQGFQPSKNSSTLGGKRAPQAKSRRVTHAELRQRRRDIVSSLPEGEHALREKMRTFSAMTGKELSAGWELDEIDFLLAKD